VYERTKETMASHGASAEDSPQIDVSI